MNNVLGVAISFFVGGCLGFLVAALMAAAASGDHHIDE